jgi:hypothetical protein
VAKGAATVVTRKLVVELSQQCCQEDLPDGIFTSRSITETTAVGARGCGFNSAFPEYHTHIDNLSGREPRFPWLRTVNIPPRLRLLQCKFAPEYLAKPRVLEANFQYGKKRFLASDPFEMDGRPSVLCVEKHNGLLPFDLSRERVEDLLEHPEGLEVL